MPRQHLVDETVIGVYHCHQRCVRRTFLLGDDPLTGKNYDHRKDWIEDKMRHLAAQLAVEFLGHAILSNHLHLILRIRPDLVLLWSDEEVARRWWNLCPKRKDKKGRPKEPTQQELDAMMADASQLAIWRGRLSSLSWAMRFLAEPIARRANREDGCTGRFWEGRFKCQRLLDEASLLACCLYVDLNPIRAGVAQTPETSRFTAAYLRIKAAVQPETGSDEVANDAARDAGHSAPDGWLSPIQLDERRDDREDPQPTRRASNRGFLPMTLRDYLEILDWTGRQLRDSESGTPIVRGHETETGLRRRHPSETDRDSRIETGSRQRMRRGHPSSGPRPSETDETIRDGDTHSIESETSRPGHPSSVRDGDTHHPRGSETGTPIIREGNIREVDTHRQQPDRDGPRTETARRDTHRIETAATR